MNTQIELIEKKDLREQYIVRIEVLDKVKNLLLLPDIMLATTQQVADFYEVDKDTVTWHIRNNRDELNSDGLTVWNSNDFRKEFDSVLKISGRRGGFNVEFSNGDKLESSNKGTTLFTRRAILRIGMLLRDSNIAKEVRTQLLNIEEKVTNEVKVQEIDKERQLVLDVVFGKDEIERAIATRSLLEYKNRHILKLEKENDDLGTEIGLLTHKTRTWSDRGVCNALMRNYAMKCTNKLYGKAWGVLYKELKYKKSIDVKARQGKGNLIDKIKDSEWKSVLEVATALCKSEGINVGKVINEINKENLCEA